MLGPVENVSLGRFGVIGGNELFFHNILGLLHRGGGLHPLQLLYHLLGQPVQVVLAEPLGGNADIGF